MPQPFEHWLSVDLSSRVATLALHRVDASGPRLVREADLGEGPQHSEKLIPSLQALLSDSAVEVSELDRFVTTIGPGSFTGLRIALASLKALTLAKGKPLELMGGSEARGLAWLVETRPPSLPPELRVLSHVALDKLVLARFEVAGPNTLVAVQDTVITLAELAGLPEAGGIWLLDDRISRDRLPEAATSHVFALRARHLATALPHAKSRRSLTSQADWIAAAPRYFGDSKY